MKIEITNPIKEKDLDRYLKIICTLITKSNEAMDSLVPIIENKKYKIDIIIKEIESLKDE